MAFFFFNKKFEIGRGHSLSQIPLFSALSGQHIRFLEKRVRLVEFKKGSWIYKRGEEGNALYVIVSGRVRLYGEDKLGVLKTLNTLYRGDYLGEVSLLTDSKRTVSAQAVNDALILQINKVEFHEILKEIPPLAIQLSRSMGLRLSRRAASAENLGEAKIVSVYHMRRGIGKTVFLNNFAASLVKETGRKVIVIEIVNARAGASRKDAVRLDSVNFSEKPEWKNKVTKGKFGFSTLAVITESPSEELIGRFVNLLSHLLTDFNYVMIDLAGELSHLVIKTMEQSDAAYILTDAFSDRLEETRETLDELKVHFKLTPEHVRILAVEAEIPDKLRLRQVERLLKFPVFHQIPFEASLKDSIWNLDLIALKNPDCLYSRVVRYLARELAEVLVGLALGSGAAYGLSHIGVLKVFEDEKIPVDIVSGSSIGAFIGALWANGMSARDIEKEALSLKGWKAFFKLVGFRDFLFPLMGFLKGRRVYKYLRGLIGTVQFRDLKRPLLVPATNLFTAEEVVFREGEVARAVRASISIPGIVAPVLLNHQHLMDGGIVDPLPVEILQAAGCKKVIAVNVLSSPEDFKEGSALYRQKKTELENKLQEKGGLGKMFYAFSRRTSKKFSANIFNVLMNTIQFMEYTVAKAQSLDADITIHPVVPGSGWADFFDPAKFVKMGETKTREILPEIKRLVEEKN